MALEMMVTVGSLVREKVCLVFVVSSCILGLLLMATQPNLGFIHGRFVLYNNNVLFVAMKVKNMLLFVGNSPCVRV